MRDGDILMVENCIEPKVGKMVIAAINGEMRVKRLSKVDGVVKTFVPPSLIMNERLKLPSPFSLEPMELVPTPEPLFVPPLVCNGSYLGLETVDFAL